MEILNLIAGYILMVSGLLLIRSQSLNYSNKKAVGLLLTLVGAALLFLVVWWHILIALVLSGIIGGILASFGVKSGVTKQIEKERPDLKDE